MALELVFMKWDGSLSSHSSGQMSVISFTVTSWESQESGQRMTMAFAMGIYTTGLEPKMNESNRKTPIDLNGLWMRSLGEPVSAEGHWQSILEEAITATGSYYWGWSKIFHHKLLLLLKRVLWKKILFPHKIVISDFLKKSCFPMKNIIINFHLKCQLDLRILFDRLFYTLLRKQNDHLRGKIEF